MMKKEVVQVKDVSFSYNHTPVLSDANFVVREKDFLGVIGPNGGGKTTLLRLILGLIKPEKGKITVFGQPPDKGRTRIGYVPQHFSFDFHFPVSVLDVVLFGRLTKHKLGVKYSNEDYKVARKMLDMVGLSEYGDRQIGMLSQGERQRVFIARALATEPKMLLLDEPMSSGDPAWQKQFYALLHKLNKTMTIVFVTHDVGVIAKHMKQIACVSGTVQYQGSAKGGIGKIQGMYKCPVDLITHHH